MKRVLFALLISCAVFSFSNAQIKVSVNIGLQPIWGPTGYDHADYYYLPDIDTYYDVPNHQFVYLSAGKWITATSLPPQYRNYDLYGGYKVVVNQPKPWMHADTYRKQYARYKGYKAKQPVIRDSKETKYFEAKDHPRHGEWEKSHPDHH